MALTNRKPPFVTVLVSAYNQEQFIAEAVGSVLAQTYESLECIVVDDGSTDRTPEILTAIRDPRLRVLRQPNQGTSAARNAGIEAARGEILAFLDGDDRWRPERLSHDVAVYESEPSVGIIFHNFIRFSARGTSPADAFTFYPELNAITSRVIDRLHVGILKTPCFESIISMVELPSFFPAVSVRRSVLGPLRFHGRPAAEGAEAFLEDWHLFPLLTRNTTVAYCSEVTVEVRRHDGNFTANFESMVRPKLGSLLAMRESQLTASQRGALDRRIARMQADVGYWHVKQRDFALAAGAFVRAGLQGRPQSCLKGFISILLAAVRPAPRRPPPSVDEWL